ncbi:MAG: hypothetical protein ACKVQB_07190 [Bacteroidia bacterium]
MKKILAIVFITGWINGFAQKEMNQDLGLNLAGVFIKNQATVAPSILYRYKFKGVQLRFQVSLDGKLNSNDRDSKFGNGGSFGSFSQDTIIKFEPGKNIKYGLMAGFQKNNQIDNTSFSWYYGLDFMYLIKDFYQKGAGTVAFSNGGFDTTKTRMTLKVESKTKAHTIGIGMPIGITYKFGKRFYTSLETKFVIAYQKTNEYMFNETNQNQFGQDVTVKTESKNNSAGIDFGLKPITGICLGMFF